MHSSSLAKALGEPAAFARGRKLQEAAPADRWTVKILSFPIFDHGFREAIAGSRLANLQFVLAVEVDTASQFAVKVFEWTATSAPVLHEQLTSRTPTHEQYWTFVKAAKVVFADSLGYQMGFARCAKVPRQRTDKPITEFQRGMAIRALAAPVLASKAKARSSLLPASSSTTPLLDHELGEKQKWAARLQAIAESRATCEELLFYQPIGRDSIERGAVAAAAPGAHLWSSGDNVKLHSEVREWRCGRRIAPSPSTLFLMISSLNTVLFLTRRNAVQQ